MCTKCDAEFMDKSELNQHLLSHQKIVCIVCSKLFSTDTQLLQHCMNMHKVQEGLVLEEHQCKHCFKIYSTKSSMNEHIKAAHKNKGPFSCTVCGLVFVHASNMRTHRAAKHFNRKSRQIESEPKVMKQQTLSDPVIVLTEKEKDIVTNTDFSFLVSTSNLLGDTDLQSKFPTLSSHLLSEDLVPVDKNTDNNSLVTDFLLNL